MNAAGPLPQIVTEEIGLEGLDGLSLGGKQRCCMQMNSELSNRRSLN